MAIRKNKKFIDPRYFMDEKTDIIKESPTRARSQFADMRDGDSVEQAKEQLAILKSKPRSLLNLNQVLDNARNTAAYQHQFGKAPNSDGRTITDIYGFDHYAVGLGPGRFGYVSHDPILKMVVRGICKSLGKDKENCQPLYKFGDREAGYGMNVALFGDDKNNRTEFGKIVDDLYNTLWNELRASTEDKD
tara:strand:+ start:65 stop:634 length:570 start_codon:yes stop_codon:yes gene_type:complete